MDIPEVSEEAEEEEAEEEAEIADPDNWSDEEVKVIQGIKHFKTPYGIVEASKTKQNEYKQNEMK